MLSLKQFSLQTFLTWQSEVFGDCVSNSNTQIRPFPSLYQLPKRFWESNTCFFPKHTCRNTGILCRVQAWKWNRKGRREKQTSEIWERSPKKSYFLWHVGWRSYLLWFALQHHNKAWPEIMSLSSSLETMQILKIIIKNQFRWVQQMKGCSDPQATRQIDNPSSVGMKATHSFALWLAWDRRYAEAMVTFPDLRGRDCLKTDAVRLQRSYISHLWGCH